MADIPEGFHTITPDLAVSPAAEAIDFYKRAFGAVEVFRLDEGTRVLHATLRIGDSNVMLADPYPGWPARQPGSQVTLHLHVEEADAAYKKAVEAGAQVVLAIHDAPWGRPLRDRGRSVRHQLVDGLAARTGGSGGSEEAIAETERVASGE